MLQEAPEQDLLGKQTSDLQTGVVVSGETITGTLHHQEGYYFAMQVVPPVGADLDRSTLEVWGKELNPQDDGGKPILIKRLKNATGSKTSGTFDVVADWGSGVVRRTYSYDFALEGGTP